MKNPKKTSPIAFKINSYAKSSFVRANPLKVFARGLFADPWEGRRYGEEE